MTQSKQGSRGSQTEPRGEREASANASAVQKTRRPYSPPCVQKRRSVHVATLVSSGGTSGTLTSGGP